MRLMGKVAIVTGAASGMGAATAKLFAAEGAKVILTDILEQEGKGLAKEIGGEARFHKLDVTSEVDWDALVFEALSTYGRIDVLINNAGVMNCPNWKTEDGFDMQLGTNHLGHFLLTELLMPLLKESVATGFHPRLHYPSYLPLLDSKLAIILTGLSMFQAGHTYLVQ